jgi:hypothetical protein
MVMDSRINTLCDELSKMRIEVIPSSTLTYISVEPTLLDQIIMAQLVDKGVQIIKVNLNQKVEKYKCFLQDSKGILWFEDRLVVTKNRDLKKKILDEAHLSKLSMHPGSTKMYHDLKPLYWWTMMKREIAKYVTKCDTCQRIKASHLKLAGALQPLSIPSWKWDDINIDFIVGLPYTSRHHDSIWVIVGLPNTSRHHDSIWVIVDRLTKVVHFLPVHTTDKAHKYAELYIDQIMCLHGLPRTIVFDGRAQFIAKFWEQLQESLRTKLIRSSTYHPQTDGQAERVNQVLEDMLRACAIDYGKNWDKCLSLAEFAYNNSYQSSLKMAPFEALYGRRCRTPINWSQPGEREIFGPDLVSEAERKVKIIRKNLEASQARKKSYHDKRRKPLQFEVGDYVYLKVLPTKGVQRFGIKGKLAPRYIGPYEIIEACGPVAYKLKLPPKMSAIHNAFHVSQLKKCIRLPMEVLTEPDVEIEPDLSYQEHPSKILDCKERSTRARTIKMYNIQWSNQTEEEATWETEDFLRTNYPDCLPKEVGTCNTLGVTCTKT